MLPLLLTILSSLTISLLLKMNEERKGDRIVVAGANYIVAASLGFLLSDPAGSLEPLWIGLGMLIGGGFVAGFMVLMRTIRVAGLAITASVARIATLGPVLLAILFYDELPSPLEFAGILLGVVSFLLLGLDQSRRDRAGSLGRSGLLLLGAVFLVMTGNDFSMKAAQVARVDPGALLLVVFGSAAVICWGSILLRSLWRRRHDAPALPATFRRDLVRGLSLGLPNFFSSWFLLAALAVIPASIVFPITSAAGVLLSALAAVLIWKERPGRPGWIGIAVAALAVALMGVG